MPLVTTVIDDRSPLIAYDNTWIPGSSVDQLASDYYLGTFMTNTVTDGSVTFNFNGTAVWLYGAKRSNHGSYAVQVDSQTYSGFNGAGNNLFQQSLFNSSLNQGTHTVTLTNTATGGLYVDIDMIVWQSEVGDTDDQLAIETIQDSDPRFQYQEPAWATSTSDNSSNLYLFNNGSGHITQTYNASVTFTFTVGFLSSSGEAVSLFGTSGPSNGPYSVQLDSGPTVKYNATNVYPTNYGVMIYHADNLGSGLHEIVLTNLPASNGQSLAVDYAQLWTINTTASSISSLNNTSTLSSGAIAGIVIAAVAAVLCAGLATLFYRRWKGVLATHQDLYRVYALHQRGPPESSTAPPTGFSSSLEMRNDATLLWNNNFAQTSTGRTQERPPNRTSQLGGAVQASTSSRNSQGIIESTGSPAHSPVDEAPRGLSLTTEPLKLAGSRRSQDVMTLDHSSIAVSEVPPNYIQAIGNR